MVSNSVSIQQYGLQLIVVVMLAVAGHAFVSVPTRVVYSSSLEQRGRHGRQANRFQPLAAGSVTDEISSEVQALFDNVEQKMIQSNGKVSVDVLEPILARIEATNTYDEPNRSQTYKGQWYTWYTNCPPPSNGQLGPFQGSSEQEIPLTGNSYDNILRLPPNSENSWLTVTLEGKWEDWNGILLDDDNNDDGSSSSGNNTNEEDWGAKYWKVTFLRLNFSLFGNKVFSQEFPPNVARVWRTTYLNDTTGTRIVRAGQTGRIDDEYVFYMKRTPRPTTSSS